MYQYILIAIVALVGSFIQSVSGFGFGIFAMMFLPYLIGSFPEANVSSNIISSVMSIYIMIKLLPKVDIKNIPIPAIGNILLTALSVKILAGQETDFIIKLFLGIVLILLSLFFLFFSDKVHIKPTWYNGLLSGTLSGILNGFFSMGGPPMVIYYLESEKDKTVYYATIQTFFAITNICSIVVKATAGFVTINVIKSAAIGISGMIVGTFIGTKVFNKMNAKILRLCTYLVMATSGIINIVTSILKLI